MNNGQGESSTPWSSGKDLLALHHHFSPLMNVSPLKVLVSGTKNYTSVHLWRAPATWEKSCVELGTGSAVCLPQAPSLESSCASKCHVGSTAHSSQCSKSLPPLSTQAQVGPCEKVAICSGSPLLFKDSCKAGLGKCVRKALSSVLGMLRMENNWSEQRQSHRDKAQVCASEIIAQLETASILGW